MDGGDKRESPDSSAQSKSPRTLRNSMHGNRETWLASVAPSGGRPVGEGYGRTTHRRAGQESDLGVVPMKGSNKGGATDRGEPGGKAWDQGERPPATHATDTVRVTHVPGAEGRASSPSIALGRQTAEVGAVCGKAARTDLCGG